MNQTTIVTEGPYLVRGAGPPAHKQIFTDAPALCAFARFCDPQGQVLRLVLEIDPPTAARLVEQQAGDCPGGRPWVRGGVEVIGADGSAYEVRNRVALCRCRASRYRPFCDASHGAAGFSDAH